MNCAMPKFKAPSLDRPDGGEYGDSVPGATGPASSAYLSRLWFGSSVGTTYEYQVYAMSHAQLWFYGDEYVRGAPLNESAKAKKMLAGLQSFVGRPLCGGIAGMQAQAKEAGVTFEFLRTEQHVVTTRKPSLRANVWKAAHRVAAMCLHGLEQVPDDIEPMEKAILQERAWLTWWRTLSPWARASLARACEARIREMLDDPRRTVQWWLQHFATYDWRGKQYGYAIRPIVGKTKRACLDVFVGQWIDPESTVVAQAERLLAQANETRAAQGEPTWPWLQFQLTA